MFTGIIEELGIVRSITPRENLLTLTIGVKPPFSDVVKGESIAVNGVCLTVTSVADGQVTFDVVKETMDKTNLRNLSDGRPVNLERALRVGDRLSGHFVTGHVDGTGVIKEIVLKPNYTEFRLSLPPELMPYIVQKGSICLDGISLTVGTVGVNECAIYLIPYTLQVTTFGSKKVGDLINIEIDILARYVKNQ